MKKSLFFIAFAAIVGSTLAYAQPRAIGGRLGSGIGLTYEHSIGADNMISLDLEMPVLFKLDLPNNTFYPGLGFGATCTYDWINPFSTQIPWEHKGEWNWYMGVGAGFGGHFYPTLYNQFYVGAAGRLGVEYNFWFPLQLSIDYRPTLGLTVKQGDNPIGFNMPGLISSALAFSVRYRF